MRVEKISQYQVKPTMRGGILKRSILRKLYQFADNQSSLRHQQQINKISKWFDNIYEDIPFLLIPRAALCALLLFTGYVLYDFDKMQKERTEKAQKQQTEQIRNIEPDKSNGSETDWDEYDKMRHIMIKKRDKLLKEGK